MLTIEYTSSFKKDFKKIKKRGYDLAIFSKIIGLLSEQKLLSIKYKHHTLIGKYTGFRECHLQSDWLLVYRINNEVLSLVCTGSHSDLFNNT